MKNRELLRVPAEILQPSNPITFEVKELNKFVSLVKLKVFYQGITPDNREFTKSFSEKVLASLPQTPVVAYYNGDDFVGHNYEQYVYGYVPEIGEIGFEEIGDQIWAVTDIVLFTGRNDNIGEVASKIFNKKHSLELSENTSYKIVEDDSGNSKIIFTDTDGDIGLSVLGDDQQPGFTGSEFFVEDTNTLETLIKQYALIKEQELLPLNFTESFKSGGAVMDLKQTIAHLNDFMRATFDEIYQEVQKALTEQNEYFYIIDISDNMVAYMDFEDGTYYRANYDRTEEGVIFDAAEIVKPRFLTDEEIDKIFKDVETSFDDLDQNPTDGDNDLLKAEDGTEDDNTEVPVDPEDPTPEEGEEDDGNDDKDDFPVDVDDLTPSKKRKKEETQASQTPQFSQEELEQLQKDLIELESYRFKEKMSILESFKEYLSDKETNEFVNNLKDYTVDSLNQELSVIAMNKIRNAKDNDQFSSVIGIKLMSQNGKKVKSENSLLARLIEENK